MDKKNFGFGFSSGLAVAGILFALGCGSGVKASQVASPATKLADDACLLLDVVAPDNKTQQQICAYENELKPLVPLILAGRARTLDAGAADAKSDH